MSLLRFHPRQHLRQHRRRRHDHLRPLRRRPFRRHPLCLRPHPHPGMSRPVRTFRTNVLLAVPMHTVESQLTQVASARRESVGRPRTVEQISVRHTNRTWMNAVAHFHHCRRRLPLRLGSQPRLRHRHQSHHRLRYHTIRPLLARCCRRQVLDPRTRASSRGSSKWPEPSTTSMRRPMPTDSLLCSKAWNLLTSRSRLRLGA